jgi:hypothetical protein
MLASLPLLRRLRRGIAAPRPTSEALFVKLRQVCTVVDDFEATLARQVEQLGLGPFRCWYFRPPHLNTTTFRGAPAHWTMKLGITWLDDVQWEVIQPMEGQTLYREHLANHGRGVQHLIMSTGEVPWEEAAACLAARGHPFAQTARVNVPLQIRSFTVPPLPNRIAAPVSLQFGYVDAEATLRTCIELTRYPLGVPERLALRLGKAEFCVPPGDSHYERPLPHRRVGPVVKITIVTRDLAATVHQWREVAGVGPWHLFDRDREQLAHVTVAGAPAAFGVRIGWAMIDDVLLELVEPREGSSPYHQILSTRGEGVAFVGVQAGSQGLPALRRHCQGLGQATLMEQPLVGAHGSAVVGSRRDLGTDLELVDSRGESMRSIFWRTAPDRAG